MEDDSPLQDDRTHGLENFLQRWNHEDCEKDIHGTSSQKKCDVALKDANLTSVQEVRLKSRRLHNPYLIDDDAAEQENMRVPHRLRSPPLSTKTSTNENTQNSHQTWDTDAEDGLGDYKAALELLDLTIQPHLTSEGETQDCEVQRNECVCDFPSFATTTSILDSDEDSLDVYHSDDKVQGTRNKRSNNITEPKSSVRPMSPVKLSVTTESVIRPSDATKVLEETNSLISFPHEEVIDKFVPSCSLETNTTHRNTSSKLAGSSRPQSPLEITSFFKPNPPESTDTQRPHSPPDPSVPFNIENSIENVSYSRSKSPEQLTDSIRSKSPIDISVLQPQSSTVVSNELRSQSPVAVNSPFRSNSPVEVNKFSVAHCPLESNSSSTLTLPANETSSAEKALNTHSLLGQTVEITNSPKLLCPDHVQSSPRSLSPIHSTNSPRSLSPVEIMDFLRPSSPVEIANSPISCSPARFINSIKPRSSVETSSSIGQKFGEETKMLRPQSFREHPSSFKSESAIGHTSFRSCSPEKATNFLRPRLFCDRTNMKTNILRPLSQIENASLTTSQCSVPLLSSFTSQSSSELQSPKLFSHNSTNSDRPQPSVEEFLRPNSPQELSTILGKSPNNSFRKQSCTETVNKNEQFISSSRTQGSEEVNGRISSVEQRIQSDTLPEESHTQPSGDLRLSDGRDSVQLSGELDLHYEETRPIVSSSVTTVQWLPEEINPQLTAEQRTEDGRSEPISEETRQQAPVESRTTFNRNLHSNGSAAFAAEDAERSRALRRPSWLRASMRRVTHFQLAEPPSTLPPLATTDTVLDILESNNRRPNSAPGGGGSRARRADFPRRFSSYSATILNNSSSVTNLTQAAEPVAVESPSSEDDDDEEEEEEDVSSSSDGARSPRHQQEQQDPEETENPGGSSPLGEWPHSLSSMLASLGCTLGLFNISRFAILSIHFGANFIVQFLLLTLVLGIPLFTLNTCLGQCLCSGVMDMWHISPIFQGVGIALIVSQVLIGIYSIVGISWMFIYFRDSFITKQDRYRWAESYQPFREDSGVNGTAQLEQTVPDYLNGIVLQRHNLASSESSFGHVKFQVAFNLAVVWMIVFVSLSKGLKSYGKVVYVFSLFPVFGMLVLCTKLLGLTPTNVTHQVFPETVWPEFFLNTKSWVAALSEVFFTWGLLGAAAMQIASHNRHKHLLSRDTSLVIVLTLAVLLLAAFLANTCVSLLNSHGYEYVPSSFEHRSTYGFLQKRANLHPRFTSTPVRYMSHTTLITGTRVIVPTADQRHQSGYQVLRLATELVPATLALMGAEAVSPFWAVLFYFVIILFGIAQQLCIWHCVITGIMAINAASLKSWETTITFFSCAGGFILGLPMTTELGIFVVYFLDYAVGCAWWIMLLYLLEIIAVFVVRGRPYSGETVVATLFNRAGCLQTWAAPMLIFKWNVILPVALVVMCIVVFKSGQFHDLYDWRTVGYEYWAVWTREVGCMLQILPIVVVPLVCVIQTCRYLSNGPRDILDRIQLLYRPSLTRQDVISAPSSPANSATSAPAVTNNTLPIPAPETSVTPIEDPPPKYTPPPSYTTATGARIAKLLRQSFRRSMRRITHALSDNSNSAQPPPPDYAAVLVEINRSLQDRDEQESSMPASRTSTLPSRTSTLPSRSSTMTAADVAHILRSSLRRNAQRNRDAEQLVDGAAPIHQDRGNSPPALRTETESKPENSSVI